MTVPISAPMARESDTSFTFAVSNIRTTSFTIIAAPSFIEARWYARHLFGEPTRIELSTEPPQVILTHRGIGLARVIVVTCTCTRQPCRTHRHPQELKMESVEMNMADLSEAIEAASQCYTWVGFAADEDGEEGLWLPISKAQASEIGQAASACDWETIPVYELDGERVYIGLGPEPEA